MDLNLRSLALSGSLSGSLWLSLALSGPIWLSLAPSCSLLLSQALYCSPNLLTKSSLGSQSPCSARSSAAALHDFMLVCPTHFLTFGALMILYDMLFLGVFAL